jgi:hypothetical protein
MLPLRKELFWDVDFETLEIEKHKRLIIERVLTLGNLDEFFFITKTYTTDTLKETIKTIGYLDPKTMSFVISHFKLKKNQLKCYTKKQSAAQHWI